MLQIPIMRAMFKKKLTYTLIQSQEIWNIYAPAVMQRHCLQHDSDKILLLREFYAIYAVGYSYNYFFFYHFWYINYQLSSFNFMVQEVVIVL